MDAPRAWQPNYTDLGDDRTMRFAGRCVVCDARYASPLVRLPSGRDVAGALTPEIFQEERQAAFDAFDAAFRELGIACPRCKRTGCPDCWDGDHKLCGSCVAELGLDRSPHHGLLTVGPLADGRLERLEPGRYSEPARPAWLRSLIDTKPALDPFPAAGTLTGQHPPAQAPRSQPTPPPLTQTSAASPLVFSRATTPAIGIASAPAARTRGHLAVRVTSVILTLFASLVVGLLVAAVVSPDFNALVLRDVNIDPHAIFVQIVSLIQQLGRLLH